MLAEISCNALHIYSNAGMWNNSQEKKSGI